MSMMITIFHKPLFANLEGNGGETFEKKKKSKWEKQKTLGGESFGGFIFLHNTKSSSLGNIKIVLEESF